MKRLFHPTFALLVFVVLVMTAATYTVFQLPVNPAPSTNTWIEIWDGSATPKSGRVMPILANQPNTWTAAQTFSNATFSGTVTVNTLDIGDILITNSISSSNLLTGDIVSTNSATFQNATAGKIAIFDSSKRLTNATVAIGDIGASPTVARGDMIYRGASGDAALTLGNRWTALVNNGTDPVWGYDSVFGAMTKFPKIAVWQATGASTAFSVLGDSVASVGTATVDAGGATETGSINLASAASTAGQTNVFNGGTTWRTDWPCRVNVHFRMVETNAVRYWCGLIGSTTTTTWGSDDPTGNLAAFRYSSAAGDTTWKCVSNDNSGGGLVVDSGVAANTSPVSLSVIFVPGASATFYINNVAVCTNVANLPAAGSALSIKMGGVTLEDVVKNMRVYHVYADQTGAQP